MPKILLRQKDTTYEQVDNIRAIEPPLFMIIRAKETGAMIIDEEVGDKLPEGTDKEDIELCNVGYLKILSKIPNFNINTQINFNLINLDKYRAHHWFGFGGYPLSPYACLFTSLGCPYSCDFCSVKSFYNKPYEIKNIDIVIEELQYLHSIGVKTIRFLDEIMFFNNERTKELCQKIIKNRLTGLNMFGYTRIDTIDIKDLNLFRDAGFRWLGFGIESGNQEIRDKSSTKSYTNEEILELRNELKKADIAFNANFIFGFPNDNYETMGETFKFAVAINSEFTNFYSMMAYPGTKVHYLASKYGWDIPQTKLQYSQYSYECLPMRTYHLTATEVLRFRDEAFTSFYINPIYLTMLRKKFGNKTVEEVKKITNIQIKRKLYENTVCNSPT